MNDTLRITCPTCNGARTVNQPHPSGNQELEREIDCTHPDCEGGEIEVDASEIDRIVKAAREYANATAALAAGRAPTLAKFTELNRALIGIGA